MKDALYCFSYKSGKPDDKAANMVIGQYISVGCIDIVDRTERKYEWIPDEVFSDPENFVLKIKDFGAIESQSLRRNAYTCHVEWGSSAAREVIARSHPFTLYGSEESVERNLEKARSFSHLVAYCIVSDRRDLLQSYSPLSLNDDMYDSARKKILDFERDYGEFNYFDNVEVLELYGNGATKSDAHASLYKPRKISVRDRFAVTQVKIAYIVSPNGVVVDYLRMILSVYCNGSVLKVSDIQLYDE